MATSRANAERARKYQIEEVLGQRIFNGEIEYLIKWKGFSAKHNTWEPEGNVDSTLVDEIKKLNESNESKATTTNKPKQTLSSAKNSQKDDVSEFDRGLEPEKILGATKEGGLQFLIKWKDSDEGAFVPAKEAHVRCPQLVIAFYEQILTFEP